MKKSSTVMFSSLVLASSLFITACNDDSNAENVAELAQYTQQGKTYLEQSQFKAAINSASNAIILYPDQQDGYVILAKVYNKLGQSNQALDVLNRYQGQKDADFYLLLLESYQRTKKVISANKLIEQQSDLLSSKGDDFKLLKAKLLLLENKPEQALSIFAELQQQAGFESDGFIGEARITASNDKDAALALLDKAMVSEPKNTEALMLKGFLLLEKGQIEQAESTLSFALSELPSSDIFTPERINILKALTSILTSQGRSSEALLYSRILSDEFPTATTVNEYYISAQEYYKRKQLGEAKEALQKILEIDPNNKKASTMLGVILYTEGDINGAEKYLSGMIDPEVNTPQLTQIYAMTQLKLNQSNDVLDILDDVIEYEERLDTLTLYAIAAIAEKQFDKADIAIDRIKKLFPDSPKLTLIESSYLNEKSPEKEQEVLDLLATGLAKNSTDLSLQTVYLKKLIAMQRLDEADRFIGNEVNKAGVSVGTRLLIANYYLYRNQYSLAEQSFNQILKVSDDNLQSYYGLAQSKQLQQDWSSAFSYYNQIIDLYPEQIKAYYGAVISTQEQRKELLNIEDSLSSKHNPSILALVLADYQYQNKQFSEADKTIKKAINLPVDLVDKSDTLQQQISNQRIIAAIRAKDYTSARELTLAQLQLTPTQSIFLMRLAAIETLSGQYAEADKVLKQIEVILPDNPQVAVLKAQLAMAQKDDTKAAQILSDEWNKNNNDEIAVELYKIYQQSDKNKAEAFLTKWLIAAPSSLYANLNSGMSLQLKGENEAAIQAYEKVLSVSPNELTSLNNAAWLYSLEKDPKAEVLAAKAYEIAPNNPAVLDTYGWILHQSGKTAEAKPLIKKALTLLPDNVEIQKHWQEVAE